MSLPASAPRAAAVHLFADGASRGNPGPAGAGWVLCRGANDEPFASGHLFLGRRTNNEAEYLAAICVLQAALDLGIRDAVLCADSELLVRQINGQYRVRNARLLPLFAQLKTLATQFATLRVTHVRREFNTLADAQANRAIDEA